MISTGITVIVAYTTRSMTAALTWDAEGSDQPHRTLAKRLVRNPKVGEHQLCPPKR
jgi:hypothetical protein